MTDNRRRITFWFEFASTYSYLSAMRIEAAARSRNVVVDWRPFLLGPIFTAQGWPSSPFNVYPAKGRYMWRDMERRAQKLGLPFLRPHEQVPERFPQHSVLAARAALVALDTDWGRAYCRNVFEAQFAQGRDIADADVLARAITHAGGDPRGVLARAVSDDVKARLRANVDEAITHGIFGAPSFIAQGELFWGDDRLEDALDWAMQERR